MMGAAAATAAAATTLSARYERRAWSAPSPLLLLLALYAFACRPADATHRVLSSPAAVVTSVAPAYGSVCGGTLLTLTGSNFAPGVQGNVVLLGTKQCQIRTATSTEITCVTPPVDSPGLLATAAQKNAGPQQAAAFPVVVRAGGVHATLPPTVSFTYARASTPVVETFSPIAGHGHDLLTLHGWGLEKAEISVGAQACKTWRQGDSFAQCVLAAAPQGVVPITISVAGFGNACLAPRAPAPQFQYGLSVLSVRPTESLVSTGSFGGGGPELAIVGKGFSELDRFVLCDHTVCQLTSPPKFESAFLHEGDPTFQEMRCQPGALRDAQGPRLVMPQAAAPAVAGNGVAVQPRYEDNDEDEDAPRRTCPLMIRAPSGSASDAFAAAWTYTHEATPELTAVSVEAGANIAAPGAAPASSPQPGSPASASAPSPAGAPAGTPAVDPLVTVLGSGFTSPSLAGPGMPAVPDVTVTVGSATCVLETVSENEIRCRLPAATSAALPAPVSVRVRGKGLAVETTVGSALLRRAVPTVSPLEGLVSPTVVPSLTDTMKSFAAARCRVDSVSTDCPPGWECCSNGCKPYCRPSLLQRRLRH